MTLRGLRIKDPSEPSCDLVKDGTKRAVYLRGIELGNYYRNDRLITTNKEGDY
jgi:hypothetical protein